MTADVPRVVVGETHRTDMDGAAGPLAFDQFGDSRSKVLTVYRVVVAPGKAVKSEALR